MTLCGDVYTVKHSMYDGFLLSSDTKLLCGSMQTDSRLVSSVSTFSKMILLQPGPLVSHSPPSLRFLLLLCGDIERHPGPSQIEDRVKCLETKVNNQAGRPEEKLNKLIDMTSATRSHNKQLEQKFQQLEDSIYDNNKQIQLQFSLLNASVSALQSAIK